MLYKCMLLGAIVLCCKKIGEFVVSAHQERVQAMCALHDGCRAMSEALVQKEYTFPRALCWAEETSKLGLFGALAERLRKDPTAEVQPLAEAAFEACGRAVDADLREACLQYFSEAAAAETKTQLQQSGAACLEKMAERLRALEREQRDKAKVVRAVSLSAGFTVAILLL